MVKLIQSSILISWYTVLMPQCGYEIVDLLKMTFKMSSHPKNNYRIFMYVFSSFQWYITCLWMKKLNFCHFSSTSFKNGVKMTLKPKKNYIFLKHKFSAFKWYITCHDIRKLIFCHFFMYELQNGFKMSFKLKRIIES